MKTVTPELQEFMGGLATPLDPAKPNDVVDAAETLLRERTGLSLTIAEMSTTIEQQSQYAVDQAARMEQLNAKAKLDDEAIAEQDAKVVRMQSEIDNLTARVTDADNPFAGKTEEVSAMIDNQAKADFCGILQALQDASRSPLEKQTIITNAIKRFQ